MISFLVVALLASPLAPSVTSTSARLEVTSGHSRVFSGEQVQLRCSISDSHNSTWDYLWFKDSKRLPQNSETPTLTLRGSIAESGAFQCQGVRDTAVGDIFTLKSPPVDINVDGGWAILQGPLHPVLVGEAMNVTCRVRGSPPLHEVILYKNGVAVTTQSDFSPRLYLPRLNLEDQGLYSCRASWDNHGQTYSGISAGVQVQVLELLTQPVLEVVADNDLLQVDLMKLVCRVQYNARAPAPPINYYFYKDNRRVGTATSENFNLVKRTPGLYSCKAKVPHLGLSKWSEEEAFEE
ncbi:high affinity immunoglobulin gamma Fc receptor I-like [Nerophis ophidion]|uniref:high affinity immunoglobulin gamma Fc receptor I-like n=1 Tax=Nerophis ophidion TaxID=159077 RepID=UPI002ADF972B|nr:high affinity immunoglobulin gamma Fc receptor I-like [Nerophis ophidion]